jgi:hypothetical protein
VYRRTNIMANATNQGRRNRTILLTFSG